MMIKRLRRPGQQGFTIVELMIALSILSVLLITSTIVLIQIGALYSKGVNTADLQNDTRAVVADISGQLQFSGKVPNGCTPIATTCFANRHDYHNGVDSTAETVYSYCISDTRYSYVLNRELGGDSTTTPPQTTPHVLWRDTLASNTSVCPTMDITQANPPTTLGNCFNRDRVTGVESPTDCMSKPDSGYEMLGNHMRLTRFKTGLVADTSIYNVEVWTAFGDTELVRPDPDPAALPGHSVCSGEAGTQFCATADITTQLTGRIY